jgi:mannose-6-phosphate isomerase
VSAPLRATCAALRQWLLDDAYPLWWTHGADHQRGGFHECLQADGQPVHAPRRARLHPRQIYAYSLADDLGCDGLTLPAVRHGLDFYLRHYPRADGLMRTLVAPDGASLSDEVLLYDQAFALFGLAAAFEVLNDESIRDRARDLLALLRRSFAHPLGGFIEAPAADIPLTSNSHMHLFEAAMAWRELDSDPRWQTLGAEMAELAVTRFRHDGQIREFFTADWSPVPGHEGERVEPGHQFEWAWLLLRWATPLKDQRIATAALALLDLAEARGVDAQRGVAMNALLADGAIHDGQARLWPQTERLKAACLAWETTRAPRYRAMAEQAATAIQRYLQTPMPGLWRDVMDIDGKLLEQPSPASSFYHLACAIAELDGTLQRSG